MELDMADRETRSRTTDSRIGDGGTFVPLIHTSKRPLATPAGIEFYMLFNEIPSARYPRTDNYA